MLKFITTYKRRSMKVELFGCTNHLSQFHELFLSPNLIYEFSMNMTCMPLYTFKE